MKRRKFIPTSQTQCEAALGQSRDGCKLQTYNIRLFSPFSANPDLFLFGSSVMQDSDIGCVDARFCKLASLQLLYDIGLFFIAAFIEKSVLTKLL